MEKDYCFDDKTYDVAIIGAGPGGIYAAYELIKNDPSLNIVIFEEGDDISKRKCPIIKGTVEQCISCKPCGIMRGFGGAGAFSDGKYNITTQFGGILSQYISEKDAIDLIKYVDEINVKHLLSLNRTITPMYSSHKSRVKENSLKHDIHLIESSVRHLGTENNYELLKSLYGLLSNKVEMRFNTKVNRFFKLRSFDGFELQLENKTQEIDIRAKYLIAAPGRAGAEWFTQQCKENGLSMINNQVDVGVRVELPHEVFKEITDEVYEAKLLYRTKRYGDIVRTFCMNPKGYVVSENTDGVTTVNGHSYSDPKMWSNNTNFALLVSNKFTEPFNEPHQYGKRIASFSNMLGGGIIVQRFGDLIKGRRTTTSRLENSFTKPTMKATPGDLSLVLPKRHLDNIIETIYALDEIAPGTANEDTLLYGVEVKFYSSRLKLTNNLETEIKNMFTIGDGAGVTRSLSQAAASGVHVARVITNRNK